MLDRNFRGVVLLIGVDGENLGKMPYLDAKNRAFEQGLDLVSVQENCPIPVLKIMDKGKFEYERKKKEKMNRNIPLPLKEIRFRPLTADHDINIKMGHVKEFIRKGHSVRISLLLKGREKQHLDEAINKMNSIMEPLKDSVRFDTMKKSTRCVEVTLHPFKK